MIVNARVRLYKNLKSQGKNLPKNAKSNKPTENKKILYSKI